MAMDLKSAVPGSLIHRPRSYVERLNWAEVFAVSQPIEVELGSGDGSFIVQWAARNPARNFLGIERLLGRLRKIDRKGRRAGLTNLRALRLEAGYAVEYLLPAGSVSVFHVYFPDPWPKRKHQKNRLVNDHFTAIAAQALVAGGMVYLRTDDEPYFAQMLEVFGRNPLFHAVETPADLQALVTDFEREFLARGVVTRRAAFQKA